MPGAIIVTGGSRGIGAATARLAARRGYDVCVNYLADETAAKAVVADVEACGRRGLAVQADTAVAADVTRLFEQAAALGPLAGLVNNAGVLTPLKPLADLDDATIARVVAINVTGAALCAREAVRRMARSRGGAGGSIVNMSSIGSRLGGAGQMVLYCATKGAMDSFSLGLAREVAGDGIRVNAVSPGLIDTEMNIGRDVPGLSRTVPIGRSGTAEEVAAAVLWLMSEEASYVVAANLEVCGGR